jgi:hypothetical protein
VRGSTMAHRGVHRPSLASVRTTLQTTIEPIIDRLAAICKFAGSANGWELAAIDETSNMKGSRGL